MVTRMSVRQRCQHPTISLEPGPQASPVNGGSSPSRVSLANRKQQRQPSRSPRSSASSLGNPYTQSSARISLPFLGGLFASLVLCSILLQSSLSIPWIPYSIGSDLPSSAKSNNNMLRRTSTGMALQPQQPQNHSNPDQPRVIYLEGRWEAGSQRRVLDDSDVVNNRQPDQDAWQSPHEQRCLPKADWQIKSYPNCNSIHEINVAVSAAEDVVDEDSLSVLGEGWFRTTWRLDRTSQLAEVESVVLKTLRIEREYLSEYYELHRRDAVAMERLTASAFVVNIYGYCGQSAINELANFPFPGIQSLESFNRRMRGKESAKTNSIKLRMAASIALGVADIHAAGSTDDSDESAYMAHYDLNPRNIALFSGGRPKINDFNIAEFLRYDPETNETCKFPSRLHEPWWRAPEEMNTTHAVLVDEKVDVYALGNILFHTLTTHSARGKQIKERMAEVRPIVAAGIRPEIPGHFTRSKDPKVLAMVKAINLCWAKDPAERASAEEIAAILYQAVLNVTDITAAQVEEKELDVQQAPSAQDDDAPEGNVEDKDAMGHAAAV